jgi:anti-anti-sigma regulatory factor
MSGLVSRNQFELSACDGRIFVRDLGSRNGTLVNNQVLRSAEREIEHGDVIDIGALSFRIKIRRAETEPEGSSSDERIGRWLAEMEGAIGSGDDAATIEIDDAIGLVEPSRCETPAAKAIHGVDETGALRYEVIEGVTVLTLLSSEYEDEAALSDLRAGLQRVSSRADLPRTMVVSLSRVGEVSSRAIGVLVAHQLRLEQAGGGLRIAEAAPHIMAKLAKIHMTLLIETFHSLDEAVIKSWD